MLHTSLTLYVRADSKRASFCNNIDGLHSMRISTIHEYAYDGFIDLIQVQVIFVEIDALVCQLN